jgi:3-deoxy-D-manno-octulosonate 8-phosphate phosphatase (KDO 8-P phosphatase)
MIELLILDVDGTLTDGSVYYGDNNVEIKEFSAKDGLVIKSLPDIGVRVIFLTGRESEAVACRAAHLNATAIQHVSDKAAKLHEIFAEYGVAAEHTAYIGDDLNDYAAMKLCGFKACPSDAAREIRDICDYVSSCAGGHGAVRDIIEHLLKRLGTWDELLRALGLE